MGRFGYHLKQKFKHSRHWKFKHLPRNQDLTFEIFHELVTFPGKHTFPSDKLPEILTKEFVRPTVIQKKAWSNFKSRHGDLLEKAEAKPLPFISIKDMFKVAPPPLKL